jgi:hypothetical protein
MVAGKDPSFVAERLMWRFRKSGAEGEHTRLMPNVDPALRDHIEQLARIQPGEVPVALFHTSDTRWALLTTDRLVWSSPAGQQELALPTITNVNTHSVFAVRPGGFGPMRVQVGTTATYIIELESGAPFYAFLNATLAAIP